MSYNYYKDVPYEYDEFISWGVCSANPSVSSLQEVILLYLGELAYYMLKLKDFGANNQVIKENILEAVSGIIANVDYNQTQFQKLTTLIVQDLSQARKVYAEVSQKRGINPEFFKSHLKVSNSSNMAEVIKKGEKYFIQRNKYYTSEQKNFSDIMFFLIKNICIKIIQIRSFKKDYENAYNTILKLLLGLSLENITIKGTKPLIDEGTNEYHNLIKVLSDAQEEAYGERESVHIPFAPRTGKAILVSGIDMTQLEAVLYATAGRNIDVYTHGMTMLMAHTLPKFKKHTNLVGHFGKSSDCSLFDFAAFPGAILMTRYLFQKVQYLYKGRLFTTDSIAPSGIVKIKNNDFEPLIRAALNSKGFTKKQQEVIQKVGFRQKFIEEMVHDLVKKMDENKIKHLYFIGILNHESEYKVYFDKFLKLMPKDCYAISLSHEKNEENVLHVDSFYDYLLIYKVLEEFNEKKPLKELNISIFITQCDHYTITNIINFINMGVKSIFLCKCAPTLVNPAMAETMRKAFGINEFSTPEEDLAKTLSQDEMR